MNKEPHMAPGRLALTRLQTEGLAGRDLPSATGQVDGPQEPSATLITGDRFWERPPVFVSRNNPDTDQLLPWGHSALPGPLLNSHHRQTHNIINSTVKGSFVIVHMSNRR